MITKKNDINNEKIIYITNMNKMIKNKLEKSINIGVYNSDRDVPGNHWARLSCKEPWFEKRP